MSLLNKIIITIVIACSCLSLCLLSTHSNNIRMQKIEKSIAIMQKQADHNKDTAWTIVYSDTFQIIKGKVIIPKRLVRDIMSK